MDHAPLFFKIVSLFCFLIGKMLRHSQIYNLKCSFKEKFKWKLNYFILTENKVSLDEMTCFQELISMLTLFLIQPRSVFSSFSFYSKCLFSPYRWDWLLIFDASLTVDTIDCMKRAGQILLWHHVLFSCCCFGDQLWKLLLLLTQNIQPGMVKNGHLIFHLSTCNFLVFFF